jgi:hypothetical protein
MKTYFKSVVGDLYLMIDNEQLKVVITHSHDSVKGLDIMKTTSSYNRYLTESTDESKWISSNETQFNDVISQVISGY